MDKNKYIVAFLDILGFKNMVLNSTFDEIMEVFKRVISDKEAGIAFYHADDEKDTSYVQYNIALGNTKIHIMSDSIIVATPDEYPESLAVVIDLCDCIQEELYSLSTPVFLRGAIEVGEFYISDNLLFGRAMVDAYIAQENYAIYPRIIVSGKICENRTVSVDGYKLPQDDDEYYYIDSLHRYLGVYNLPYEEYIKSQNYLHIKEAIDHQLTGYSDIHVREKYIWLRNALAEAVDYDGKEMKVKIKDIFNS